MICEHLRTIEAAIVAAGIAETHRGQVWTANCREWVYFDCRLDCEALMAAYDLGPTVASHKNDDPRSGLEAGLCCTECHDAVMGHHPDVAGEWPVFPAPVSGRSLIP